MDIETRQHYEASNRWHDARRRTIGDHRTSTPGGVTHLGRKITESFVADLDLLGWRVACTLDEENES